MRKRRFSCFFAPSLILGSKGNGRFADTRHLGRLEIPKTAQLVPKESLQIHPPIYCTCNRPTGNQWGVGGRLSQIYSTRDLCFTANPAL